MSARQQKTAADFNLRLDNKNLDPNSENNERVATISLSCHSAQALKFLKFPSFCALCNSCEKIIGNYQRVVIICDGAGPKPSQAALAKKFEKYENVYFFTISEIIPEWYSRLKYAGFSMTRDVMKAAFDSAKPLGRF